MQKFEKQAKKAFLGTFWKMLTKKSCFFPAFAPPVRISLYWRRWRLLDNFSVRHQKWITQNSPMGDPLARQGLNLRLLPKSAPDCDVKLFSLKLNYLLIVNLGHSNYLKTIFLTFREGMTYTLFKKLLMEIKNVFSLIV